MEGPFEDEADNAYTIDEYLEKIEAEELEVDLVLGGDEGKECTYTTGYMKRQAIFSCLTCTPDGNAGVCTACSLSCHDGHEIVELWTKRNFRCDCGNSKFGENFCKLFPKKDVENPRNSYNHNFKGSYCTCGRPYPDPDVEEAEVMIQCIVCEDWFHEHHLGLESPNEIPRDEEGEPLYEDFICKACSTICSFLTLYPQIILAAKGRVGDATAKTSKDKNVVEDIPSACGSGKLENNTCSQGFGEDKAMANANCSSATVAEPSIIGENSEENVTSNQSTKDANLLATCVLGSDAGKLENNTCSHGSGEDEAMANANCGSPTIAEPSIIGENSEKNVISNQNTKDADLLAICVLGSDAVASLSALESKPLFLAKNWRDALCRCDKCLDMYSQNNTGHLLDKEDSIAEYENMAKGKREEKLQKLEGNELSFLDKLGHVEKMEILSGIADFKEEFRTFLETVGPSKTITSSDVHQIFDNLAKKRRREE